MTSYQEEKEKILNDLCDTKAPARFHNTDWASYALDELFRTMVIGEDKHLHPKLANTYEYRELESHNELRASQRQVMENVNRYDEDRVNDLNREIRKEKGEDDE